MKKFLLKILCWLVPIIALHLYLGTFAGGNFDPFYRRFTSPKQTNLILGNSRAAQGVLPQHLYSFNGMPFFNFAFTIANSPYGESYLRAIKHKLDNKAKNGMFILCVDPWSISDRKDQLKTQPEKNGMIGKMNYFNVNPNYEYLVKNYKKSWINLYKTRDSKYKSEQYLNENGWLEITHTYNSVEDYRKNVNKKIADYKANAQNFVISQKRIQDFKQTIEFLEKHGKLILVRLPQSNQMQEIENGYAVNFNQQISSIAKDYKVQYIDFSKDGDKYYYLDGNHLQKDSGKEFTKRLNDSLKVYFRK